MGLALAGMTALALAMGVGRFAFTPILPMMQQDLGLSIREGGWLASANYLGYLLGALSAVWIRLPPALVVRAALVTIAATTAAMAASSDMAGWLALRAVAGVMSAWVLVFCSAHVLRSLAAMGRAGLGGVVFGGVGLGVALSGALCLGLLVASASWRDAWLLLGAATAVALIPIWRRLGAAAVEREPLPPRGAGSSPAREGSRLLFAYGCFGLGYILPATFLPAMARVWVPEPALFGLAWPVFGTAALLSTLVAARLAATVSYRRLWLRAQLVLAVGVAVPALHGSLAAVLLSALSVGGTFTVITLAGIQEARRAHPDDPERLIAGLTASFALGQVAGPLLVSVLASYRFGVQSALLLAALVLLAGALVLAWPQRGAASATPLRARG
jgi:predicted MFS family arabinose efflux permease